MKTLRNFWFISFCLLWTILYVGRRTGHHLPEPVNNHLADLLAVPVLARCGLAFQRYVRKDEKLQLNDPQILFIVIYLSVVFELILPWFSMRFTGDVLDVLCYGAGGLFYRRFMNR